MMSVYSPLQERAVKVQALFEAADRDGETLVTAGPMGAEEMEATLTQLAQVAAVDKIGELTRERAGRLGHLLPLRRQRHLELRTLLLQLPDQHHILFAR